MIAAFHSPLRFEDQNAGADGIRLQLIDALVYDSAVLQRSIIVPAGFVTDLASIPQLLWNVLPPIGAYDEAAVVHDYLFQQPPAGVTLPLANAVLNEAMGVCRVRRWKRCAIYAGVIVGGWVPWNRYRRAEAARA